MPVVDLPLRAIPDEDFPWQQMREEIIEHYGIDIDQVRAPNLGDLLLLIAEKKASEKE